MSLPKLSGKQMEILYLRDDKNLLIKGSAGSGKSLLTIYRSIWLSLKYPDKKVLILTFNKAVNKKMKLDLIDICRNIGIEAPENIMIKTYHALCLMTLKEILPLTGSSHISDVNQDVSDFTYIDSENKYEKSNIIKRIIEELKASKPDCIAYKRPEFVFEDEISWIQRMNIRSLEDYVAAERIGRQSARITRADRPDFYEVYVRYKQFLKQKDGYNVFDYEDIGDILESSLMLLRETNASYINNLFDFILIDEFQDFSINMLKSLQSVVTDDGILNLFGDVKQSVFGKRISMKRIGFTDFSSYNIEQNYRNSKEISLYASKIAESPYLNIDDELYVKTLNSNRVTGNEPYICSFDSNYKQMNWLKEIIKSLSNEETAILAHKKNINYIKTALNNEKIDYEEINNRYNENSSKCNVLLATVKQVKGLEFKNVIIPLQGIDEYINIINYHNENEEITKEKLYRIFDNESNEYNYIINKLEEYISEIYVAVTRAKDKLFISYKDELFPLYPKLKNEGDS